MSIIIFKLRINKYQIFTTYAYAKKRIKFFGTKYLYGN